MERGWLYEFFELRPLKPADYVEIIFCLSGSETFQTCFCQILCWWIGTNTYQMHFICVFIGTAWEEAQIKLEEFIETLHLKKMLVHDVNKFLLKFITFIFKYLG
jgi:hypothetical protein